MKPYNPGYLCSMKVCTIQWLFFVLAICLVPLTGKPVALAGPPEKITWDQLRDVSYREVYIEEMGVYYDLPQFGESVRKLDGKQIYISGYVIPVDVAANYYVLSAFPFAACFFCGGAGPESVMDVELLNQRVRFNTDDRVTFRGTLRLNDSDMYKMTYVLEDAEIFVP